MNKLLIGTALFIGLSSNVHAVAGSNIGCTKSDFLCQSLSSTIAPTAYGLKSFGQTTDGFQHKRPSNERPAEYHQGYKFYSTNYQQIQIDAARGDGPTLDTFSRIVLRGEQRVKAYKQAIKLTYAYYFPAPANYSETYQKLWQLRREIIKQAT